MRLAIFWPAQVYYDGVDYTTDGFAHLWFPELARHFGSVDLIVPMRSGRLGTNAATIDVSRIRVLPLPSARRGWQIYTSHLPLIVLGMMRLLWTHRRQWDRVLVYEVQPLSQIWLALCRLARLPVILYIGGRHEKAVLSRNSERRWLMRSLVTGWSRWCSVVAPWLTRRVPLVVTGGELVDIYAKAGGAEIHNVASSSVMQSDIVAPADAHQHLVGVDPPPTVLAVCRVTPIKGLEYLVMAIGELARRGIPVRFRIAGRHDGSYASRLAEIAAQSGVAKDVELLGPVPPGEQLRAVYDGADVFVLPSLSEGTPKVIIEAMSRGIPVIATEVGGIPDIIEHGVNGLLVPAGNSEELALALRHLLADADLRARLSLNGLETAKGLTVERQTSRLATIIKAERPTAMGRKAWAPR